MLFTKLEREYFYILIFQSEFYSEPSTDEELTEFATRIIEDGQHFEELELKPLSAEKADNVIKNYIDASHNVLELDNIIIQNTYSWGINRIGKVELALLRAFVHEIQKSDVDDNDKKIMNHLVDLAHKYGDEKSYKFVNGVLSNIYKKVIGNDI